MIVEMQIEILNGVEILVNCKTNGEGASKSENSLVSAK